MGNCFDETRISISFILVNKSGLDVEQRSAHLFRLSLSRLRSFFIHRWKNQNRTYNRSKVRHNSSGNYRWFGCQSFVGRKHSEAALPQSRSLILFFVRPPSPHWHQWLCSSRCKRYMRNQDTRWTIHRSISVFTKNCLPTCFSFFFYFHLKEREKEVKHQLVILANDANCYQIMAILCPHLNCTKHWETQLIAIFCIYITVFHINGGLFKLFACNSSAHCCFSHSDIIILYFNDWPCFNGIR